MAIVLTHVGTASSKAGAASLSVTVGAGGVPTGVCLFVLGAENVGGSNFTVGDASDSKSNSYQNPASLRNTNAGSHQQSTGIGYCYNTTNALVSSDTITIAFNGTLNATAMSVFYATGLNTASDPLDTGTIAIAEPAGTSSVTMAASPATSSSLILATAGYRGILSAFVQDSTNAAYATPPNGVGTTGAAANSNCTAAGGTIVSSSQLTYAPTTSDKTTLTIAAFAPAAASDTLMAASWM